MRHAVCACMCVGVWETAYIHYSNPCVSTYITCIGSLRYIYTVDLLSLKYSKYECHILAVLVCTRACVIAYLFAVLILKQLCKKKSFVRVCVEVCVCSGSLRCSALLPQRSGMPLTSEALCERGECEERARVSQWAYSCSLNPPLFTYKDRERRTREIGRKRKRERE